MSVDLSNSRATVRGIKKCPKCKTYNGHRTNVCRNELCRNITIKENKEAPKPTVQSCKLIVDSDCLMYSVRARNVGPDFRCFVTIEKNADSIIHKKCFIKNCILFDSCPHIEESLKATHVAESLTIDRSVLDILKVDESCKEKIWISSLNKKNPLVQRVSQSVMVVSCEKSNISPLGYLHVLFIATKNRYNCQCNMSSKKKRKVCSDDDNNNKCIHYYSCICAFASNKDLCKEFNYFVKSEFPIFSDHLCEEQIVGDKLTISIDNNYDIHIADNVYMDLDNNIYSPHSSIDLQNSNTLMLDFPNDCNDWKRKDENIPDTNCLELSDITFAKSKKDNNIGDINLVEDNVSDSIEDTMCDDQISDVILLTEEPKSEFNIEEGLDIAMSNSNIINMLTSDILKDDAGHKTNLINEVDSSDFTIITDDNSLEIISLDQYNYLIQKQYPNDVIKEKKLNNNVVTKSLLVDDCDDELLLVGIDENCLNQDLDKKRNSKDNMPKLLQDNSIIDIQNILNIQNVGDIHEISILNGNFSLNNIKPVGIPLTNNFLDTFNKTAAPKVDHFTFNHWLSSVTERINQTMHFQYNGKPNPLVFQIPTVFFENLMNRMCNNKNKMRLPSSIQPVLRTEIPIGKFTKYTWNIINIVEVQRIFSTSNVPLEVIQYYSQQPDGTYNKIEPPKPNKIKQSHKKPNICKKEPMKILPGHLITYLKVGSISSDQLSPTPFCIEWTPNILPISGIGELLIKFEYAHKNKFIM